VEKGKKAGSGCAKGGKKKELRTADLRKKKSLTLPSRETSQGEGEKVTPGSPLEEEKGKERAIHDRGTERKKEGHWFPATGPAPGAETNYKEKKKKKRDSSRARYEKEEGGGEEKAFYDDESQEGKKKVPQPAVTKKLETTPSDKKKRGRPRRHNLK